MNKWKVYRITTEDGEVYIGCTCQNPRERGYTLKARRGIVGELEVLAEYDDKDEAYAHEARLRPEPNMGLNTSAGGEVSRGYKTPGKRGKAQEFRTQSKPCVVEGVRYPSTNEASRALGLSRTLAGYRVRSTHWPDWHYEEAA